MFESSDLDDKNPVLFSPFRASSKFMNLNLLLHPLSKGLSGLKSNIVPIVSNVSKKSAASVFTLPCEYGDEACDTQTGR